jgi:hypothetical protein
LGDSVDVESVIATHLADPTTGWSLGTFGAIAEFLRSSHEPVVMETTALGASAVTDRGGIRIRPVAGLRLVASESATGESWNQRVALCLRNDQCATNRRDVLTELGRDAEAIREIDRDAILFDLGLAAMQVDACVRVADPGVVEQLRAGCGRPAFDRESPAMGAILAASPHRVFTSRVGRIEVFQPIPPPNGKSPEGPHTHVLPKLLRHRRTHSATEPIPTGWVPCAHFYPAHPMRDASGTDRPFESRPHSVFQELMCRFGDGQLVDLKKRVIAAVSAGKDPAAFPVPADRFARTTIRIGLRQLLAQKDALPTVTAWQAFHDRSHRDDDGDGGLEHGL